MNDESKRDQSAVRSFRVTDGTMERFQSIREEMGLTQESALAMLVSTYEMEKAKEMIPDRETEIANFQTKARELVDAFLFSLQLNQDAEVRIREEFARQLEAKDRTISDYQEQVRQLKTEKAALGDVETRAKELQAELNTTMEQARQDRMDFEERLADKSRALKDADARLAMLEIKADGYDDLKADRDSLADQMRDANQTIKDLQKDHGAEMERAAREAEKAQDTAVAAARAEGEAKAAELRDKLQQAQIDGAKALQDAEKQAHEADKIAAAEIRKLEQEIARLREQMAELRGKMPGEK